MVDWSYYERFEFVSEKYLPDCGEGDTMATQIVTAVNKLVYKWYNDGDVYDNQYYMSGWANDLSNYANWLALHVIFATEILERIYVIESEDEYEVLLRDLADHCLNLDLLEMYNRTPRQGTIYRCEGQFKYVEHEDDCDEWGK